MNIKKIYPTVKFVRCHACDHHDFEILEHGIVRCNNCGEVQSLFPPDDTQNVLPRARLVDPPTPLSELF